MLSYLFWTLRNKFCICELFFLSYPFFYQSFSLGENQLVDILISQPITPNTDTQFFPVCVVFFQYFPEIWVLCLGGEPFTTLTVTSLFANIFIVALGSEGLRRGGYV